MMIFVDCEYTDNIDIELISIGMVSEDGQHEFYAEIQDFSRDKCNEFVRLAVWSVLEQVDGALLMRAELSERLRAWFASLTGPITIAYDNVTDWELLVDALDGDLPPRITGRCRIGEVSNAIVFNSAVASYHTEPGRPWHHALHDARANRAGWLACEQSER